VPIELLKTKFRIQILSKKNYECMRTLEEKMKTLTVLTIAIYNSDCLDKHGSCVSS
jgi:hypothetical protein